MRTKTICLAAIFVALLSACAVHPQKGFYEGSSRSPWVHSIELGSGGMSCFAPPTKPPFHFQVTFSTIDRSKIALVIYYPLQSPVFVSRDVVVSFDDGRKDMLEAKESMVIDVSASDNFTITVPPFRLNGVDFPALEAAFKWNSSTKYYIRGIQ